MTDASLPAPIAAAASFEARTALPRRASVALIIAGAALAAAFVTPADSVAAAKAQSGDELVMLLRFMAAVKALLALGAAAAVVWRLGHPASAALTLAYTAAAALMATAPALIWHLADVGFGAAMFHAGVVTLLAALYADRHLVARHVPRLARRA
ncbi:hypothetical protein [Rhodopseudomonas palustris]|uniref:Uncharacterized protein n=1 Tax=Rhodopseudomonas palustris (strain BisB18) TaxID=316056 RepID=Q21BP3_RHOPB